MDGRPAIIFLLWLLSAMVFCPVHSDSYHFAVFFSDKKPDGLHRTLKHISNLWLGTFLYALIGIGIADFIRILLYFSPLADASWFHSRLMFAATGFFTGVLILFFSFYGFFMPKNSTQQPGISPLPKAAADMTL